MSFYAARLQLKTLLYSSLKVRLPLVTVRSARYQAFESQLDQDALAAARKWFASFDFSKLPQGNTTYARSSGPGGQHVNKTETKAITTVLLKDLLAVLPKTMHAGIRASKYYTTNNDSLTFHAQTSRSRTQNANDNKQKLLDEVTRVYHEATPSETSDEKKKKHVEIGKRFNESRLKEKKFSSAKKQSRRGPSD